MRLLSKPPQWAQVTQRRPISKGIIACYPMTGGPGRNVAVDYGPYRRAASFNGTPVFTVERYGSAFKNTAGAPYMTLPFNAGSLGVVAFSYTFRFKSFGFVSNDAFLSWGSTPTDAFPWILFNYDAAVPTNMRWYFNGNYRVNTPIQDNTWYYVTVTYDGTTYTVYLDGLPIGTYVGGSSTNYGNAQNIYLGSGFAGTINGVIDSFVLWNRCLQPQEVQKQLLTDPFVFMRPVNSIGTRGLFIPPPPGPPPPIVPVNPGYGLAEYGLDPYASATAGLAINNATAVSTRVVQVILEVEPAHASKDAPGDALNPDTWTVQRLDTGEFFTVLQVVASDPPYFYEIYVQENFGNQFVTHRVGSTTLVTADGELITDHGNHADFPGVVVTADFSTSIDAANRQLITRDLANPPAPVGSNSFGGTLQIAAGGDYITVQGPELTKKLIIRRLTTAPGGFFHLPGYGLGLRVKEPLIDNDLIKLKTKIEQQVMLEPDVEAVSAILSTMPGGTFIVQLKVQTKSTGVINIQLPAPPTQIAF